MARSSRRNRFPIRFVPATILFPALLLLVAGCAHTWHPGGAPPIPIEVVGPLGNGLSVELINDQPNTTTQLFAEVSGNTYYADYNEWTAFFIKYWTDELTKRKVAVTKESPNKIAVKLDTFAFIQGFAKVRTNMKIHLSSPDDTWSKVFDETDTSGWTIGRAFGSLIYHAVEKYMMDPEILARMKPRGDAK